MRRGYQECAAADKAAAICAYARHSRQPAFARLCHSLLTHMVFQYVFKLLYHYCCQQEPHTEGYKPASAAACDPQDTFPPAAASSSRYL